ncbi:hypothetical protein AQUCO_08200038v1 [Aquilegia coerulea]|uniref:Uncharacterized protein n=1 Tax=Aquilegia coerulea TaxID=218851 RepID=A0A2G5C7K8_AQUCA|nr:hypothetical protein AQUCO_08200038v1 [Aquilegia coerulea]
MQNGGYCLSVLLFLKMREMGMVTNRTTFAVILKCCTALVDIDLGIQIHGVTIRMGFDFDVVTGSALVDMYAKCKNLSDSHQFFREMPDINWVSWSAFIAGCDQNDRLVESLELFKEMQRDRVGVSQSTYASIFRSCAGLSSLNLGYQLHCHALKNNFVPDAIVGTAILDMYAKCDNLRDARMIFKFMPRHSLLSWNAIIVGYARSYRGLEALQLFQLMHRSGVGVDEISLSGVFSTCAVIKGYLEGLQIHGLTSKCSFETNICVANALLDMYGKCGALVEGRDVFDAIDRRDTVSWNAIIAAYEQIGYEKETLFFFSWMLRSRMEPDEFTYGSILKACAGWQTLNCGMEIHNRLIKSGLGLDFFVDVGLWPEPDNFTYATVLDTCANLATIGLGKQIHAQIIKQKMQSDVYISSTLVAMYSKCGNMQDSHLMFEKMTERDFVSWNAMISGYSQHGLGVEALQIFEKMQYENVKPNHATFEGACYFHSMVNDYGLQPQLEHYSCMVDILGRSGWVGDALKLICEMPFKADAIIWRTLLSVCKINGNVEVAELSADSILWLDPQDSTAYVLLSNVCAEAGMCGEVSKVRKIMRQNGLEKEPGCSWIEVRSKLNTFLVGGDKVHPKCEQIYEILGVLIGEMKWAGYVPETSVALTEEEEEEQQELLEFVS